MAEYYAAGLAPAQIRAAFVLASAGDTIILPAGQAGRDGSWNVIEGSSAAVIAKPGVSMHGSGVAETIFFQIGGTLNYDNQTVNFTLDDTITGGTSGATATLRKIVDNGAYGTLYLSDIKGTFQDNEPITGALDGSAQVNGTLSSSSNQSSAFFYWYKSSRTMTTEPIEVYGFKCVGPGIFSSSGYGIRVRDHEQIDFHHLWVEKKSTVLLAIDSCTRGVVWDSDFRWCILTTSYGSGGYGVAVKGAYPYTWPGSYPALGTENAIFVEDNRFYGIKQSVQGQDCANYVSRHNTISGCWGPHGQLDAHGARDTEYEDSSTLQYEFYENDITLDVVSLSTFYGHHGHGMAMRGGHGVAFNNRFHSSGDSAPSDCVVITATDIDAHTVPVYSFPGDYYLPWQPRDIFGWGNLYDDVPVPIEIYEGSVWFEEDRLSGKLPFDTQTVNFTLNDKITGGTSGAYGYLTKQTDAGTTGVLWLRNVVGTFQDNEPITDQHTGSALVNSPTGLQDAYYDYRNMERPGYTPYTYPHPLRPVVVPPGGRMREGTRLREQRLTGIRTGIATYVPPELTIKGFKLVFYNVSQAKVGELGADVQIGKISEIDFELMDFGCGAFSFVLDSLPAFPIGYRTRIDVHPYFDPAPWFSGFVQTIPKPGQKPPYRFIGFGFFEQLDWVRVTASYQNQEVSLIIKDIIQNVIAPNTQIAYNVAKIETTSYTVTDINFDHAVAKDAIQQLAAIAQGYEFGVDNSREFYFRPIDTEVYYYHWAGRQFQDVDIEEDPLSVRNKLYVKSGKIQAGGSNIVGYVLSQPSIDTHGLRDDIVTAPDVLNTADALQWASQILAEKKDPQTKARIRNVLFDTTKTKIDSKGRITITTFDGASYTLQVKRVIYRISSAGTLGEIEGGAVLTPFEEHFVNQMKQAGEEQRLADKRTKELYAETIIDKVEVQNRVATQLTISNDSAENDIFSYTVPAGLLGTTGALRLTIVGKYHNATGADRNLTIRLKFGATTIFDDAITAIPSNAAWRPFFLAVLLVAQNSASAQVLGGSISLGDYDGAAAGIGDLADSVIMSHSPIHGTASENSGAAKDFKVTVQHSLASASLEFTREYAVLELL